MNVVEQGAGSFAVHWKNIDDVTIIRECGPFFRFGSAVERESGFNPRALVDGARRVSAGAYPARIITLTAPNHMELLGVRVSETWYVGNLRNLIEQGGIDANVVDCRAEAA